MVLRKFLGIIMSVSTLGMGSGATTPVRVMKGAMPPAAAAVEWTRGERGWTPPRAWRPRLPPVRARTSVRVPAMAAAAAMAGLTRCVRPPRPWRPSKLRLDVDAHRSPGASLSSFIARHMEQPGSRQSKPASMKILSRPSASACCLTMPEPGTTRAWTTLDATLRPLATSATARRSSMRPLVHEPMNTLSTATVSSFWPAVSPIYSKARSIAVRLVASDSWAGSGTYSVTASTSCGLVPQVT
mmetsp:Transcript_21116/g.62434  ORF Transcript_21116/g.62434 Transcript_21116/m.62434 type:complete len:242 (-) Transcript_21116:971-1696(-)